MYFSSQSLVWTWQWCTVDPSPAYLITLSQTPEWLPPCHPEDPLCHVQPGVHPHLHLTVSGFHRVSKLLFSLLNASLTTEAFSPFRWHTLQNLFPELCTTWPRKTNKKNTSSLAQFVVHTLDKAHHLEEVIEIFIAVRHSELCKVKIELKETMKKQQNVKQRSWLILRSQLPPLANRKYKIIWIM